MIVCMCTHYEIDSQQYMHKHINWWSFLFLSVTNFNTKIISSPVYTLDQNVTTLEKCPLNEEVLTLIYRE